MNATAQLDALGVAVEPTVTFFVPKVDHLSLHGFRALPASSPRLAEAVGLAYRHWRNLAPWLRLGSLFLFLDGSETTAGDADVGDLIEHVHVLDDVPGLYQLLVLFP